MHTMLTFRAYQFDIVRRVKADILLVKVSLDLSVGIINDRQEHIQQDKEHKEHVEDEEDRSKDTICLLQSREVKVTQDDTKQSKTETK